MSNNPSRLSQAQSLHQAGNLSAACDIYQELLQEDPKQPDVLHALAILLSQKQCYQDAIITLRQALELEPNNPLFHNTLGLIHSQQHNTEAALECFKKATSLAPDFANAHNHLANQYRKMDDIENALKHYERAIKLDPDNVTLRFNIALMYMTLEQYTTAKQYLTQVLAAEPDHISARYHLGQIYLQISDYDQACLTFTKVLQKQPEHIDACHDLALCDIEQDKFQSAIDRLSKVLKKQPSYCDAHYHLGIAYLRQGEYSDALPHFLKQLEIQPYTECYFNIGVLLMYEGRQPEAKEYFEITLQRDPNHVDSLINLGVMALKSNDSRSALDAYKRALAIQPDNDEVRHIVNALEQNHNSDKQAPASYVKHLFNQYSPYYDHHLKQALQYQVPDLIYDLLSTQTYLQNNRWDIADLGCGTGLMAERLAPFAESLIGIDLSECMLEVACQKNLYSQLICDDVTAGLSQCTEFDFITAADVFTYLGDLQPVLQQCFAHLKAEGYLCFSVETQYQLDQFTLLPSIRYAHNPKYLQKIAEKLGFEQIDQQNIVLRQERGQAVEGLLLLWQRQ